MLQTDQDVLDLMTQLGDRELSARLMHCRQFGGYSGTQPGAYLVGQTAGRVAARLKDWTTRPLKGCHQGRRLEVREAFKTIGIDKAAAFAAGFIVDAVISDSADKLTVDTLTKRLGKALYEEAWMTSIVKANPERVKYHRKYLRSRTKKRKVVQKIANAALDDMDEEQRDQVIDWPLDIISIIGQLLVVFFVQESGIVEVVRFHRKGKPQRKLVLTSATNDWLDTQEGLARQITPVNLPMITPPRDWTTADDGGYPDGFMGRRFLMSTDSRPVLTRFANSECPEVYAAVNTAQRTAWAVNELVLDVFRTAVTQRWCYDSLRLPMYETAEPPKRPEGLEYGDPEYKVWRREYVIAQRAKARNIRLSIQCSRILHLAEVYLGSPMYFVHMLDFRGRMYPLGGFLQYQGDDRQRGLLRFDTGKPIDTQEAEDWFLIHGANSWGADKLPFPDRVAWVEEHRQDIIAVANDPIGNRWWIEADKPWQFLAWCFEAASFFRVGRGFYSYLPIGMDGSNNGLQLYSLLLRDTGGAIATNCAPSETPQDIYQDVANAVNARLRDLMKSAGALSEHKRWATRLIEYWPEGLPRSAVKRPVMTLPYGATRHSCQRYLVAWYHDEVRGKRLDPPPFPENDAYKAFTYFGSIVWEEIKKRVGGAVAAMEWLHECCDKVLKRKAGAGLSVQWTTPTGLTVIQRYKKGIRRDMKMILGKAVRITYKEPSPTTDTAKSRNGIAPNFVHSLDAALMVRTVNECRRRGVESFMMIHDSFSTHAADAPLMSEVLREEAVKLFQQDLLTSFRDELQLTYGVDLADPPEAGDFDITQLRHAKYFFA